MHCRRSLRINSSKDWCNAPPRILFVDSDILVVGGGMIGCGATYESRYWGRDLKIICVEKANIERSRTRPVCDQLLHGHAVERKSARRPCPLRTQRPHGFGAGGSGHSALTLGNSFS